MNTTGQVQSSKSGKSKKRKRNCQPLPLPRRETTLVEKIQLIRKSTENGFSQRQLAKEFQIGLGTVHNILKRKSEYLELFESDELNQQSSTRCRRSKNDQVNKLVWDWYQIAKLRGNYDISGGLVKEKALHFSQQLFPNATFKASNGWLDSFCKRHQISFRSIANEKKQQQKSMEFALFEEDSSLPIPSIWYASKPFKKVLQDYDIKDIFSCAETELLYRALPDKVYNAEKYKNGDFPNDRLTVLLCCNALGEKEPPMIIGSSTNSFSFHSTASISARQENFMWKLDNRSWMTSDIFHEWLVQLEAKMRVQKRHIALFLEQKACHIVNYEFSHIKICFFPHNLPKKLCPVHSGIISSFKTCYRVYLLRYIYARMDDASELGDLEQEIDINYALHWILSGWNYIPSSVYQKAFNIGRTYSQSNDLIDGSRDAMQVVVEELDVLLSLLAPYLSIHTCMNVDDYIKFDDNFPGHNLFEGDDWENHLLAQAVQDKLISHNDDHLTATDEDLAVDLSSLDASSSLGNDIDVPKKRSLLSNTSARRALDALRHYALEKEPTLLVDLSRASMKLDEIIAQRCMPVNRSADTKGVWV